MSVRPASQRKRWRMIARLKCDRGSTHNTDEMHDRASGSSPASHCSRAAYTMPGHVAGSAADQRQPLNDANANEGHADDQSDYTEHHQKQYGLGVRSARREPPRKSAIKAVGTVPSSIATSGNGQPDRPGSGAAMHAGQGRNQPEEAHASPTYTGAFSPSIELLLEGKVGSPLAGRSSVPQTHTIPPVISQNS
jgi:hypothetical protein